MNLEIHDIPVLCRGWTAAGIEVAEQIRMLARRGVYIGRGGDGHDARVPECPYCHARGGGGHGGLCPNARHIGLAGEAGSPETGTGGGYA